MASCAQAIRRGVFAASIAALAAAALASDPARAADDCLAAPKGQAPQGSHWFYKLDHATKRKCWYLGEQSAKARQATVKPREAARAQAPATAETEASAPERPVSAAQRPVAAAQAESPWAGARDTTSAGFGDPAQQQGAPAREGSPVQAAAAGNQDDSPQTTSAVAPWPASPAAAPATERADASAAAAATPAQSGEEPAPGPVVQGADKGARSPGAGKPQSAPGGFGWALLKIAAAVLIVGVLVYVAFRIPLGRPQRPVGARRAEPNIRRAEERFSPPLAPQHETDLPLEPTEESRIRHEPAEDAHSDPRRDLRQILQALERASSDRQRAAL